MSYAKDVEDSKLARQLWSSIGIKTVLENTQSNMHWKSWSTQHFYWQ